MKKEAKTNTVAHSKSSASPNSVKAIQRELKDYYGGISSHNHIYLSSCDKQGISKYNKVMT